jgi:thiol:disulfide interchange protein
MARLRIPLGALLLAGGLAAPAPAAGPPPGELWSRDAPGYRAATARAAASGKPLFVYFYTGWCGYCRQLERELLSTPEVTKALAQFEAVGIDAEGGSEEAMLSGRYGVSSFPSLFVHSPGPQGPIRLSRHTAAGGASRLMTAKEFAQALTDAATAAPKGT